jgi:hypothetical protein
VRLEPFLRVATTAARGRYLTLAALLGGALAAQAADLAPVASRRPDVKVATYYFYWYHWPDEHFTIEGVATHRHQFKAPQAVSYLDPAWHKAQFVEMARCGIDIALPVYWGAPGDDEIGAIRFSRRGLPPMLQALRELRAAGATAVRLGMMYDTTTLLCDVRRVEPRGGKANLRSDAGRTLFCQTIVGYFEQIPKHHWARIDGRPLVVLYTSTAAAGWHQRLGADARSAFAQRFPGEHLFLVAEQSWGDIGQDLTVGWGAALGGPIVTNGVAAIGPGYDDSLVPGRRTPVRERAGGDFYRWSFRQAITARPRLVLLETWNELHEGTEICETQETGRLYLDLTRQYIERLRRGDPGPVIDLPGNTLRHRPDHSWGAASRGAEEVYADYTTAPSRRFGLREVQVQDGPIRITAGRLRPDRARPAGTHIYFSIADAFCFDTDTTLQVLVEVDAAAQRGITLDYDARSSPGATQGDPEGNPYRAVSAVVRPAGPGLQRLAFTLPHARCANRQNAGTDFRLVIREARTMIRSVRVRRVVAAPNGGDK